MEENKSVATEETSSKISVPGFIAGLFLGAILFYITIQIVSVTMFSRTAA